jgi:hypothetical protein
MVNKILFMHLSLAEVRFPFQLPDLVTDERV